MHHCQRNNFENLKVKTYVVDSTRFTLLKSVMTVYEFNLKTHMSQPTIALFTCVPAGIGPELVQKLLSHSTAQQAANFYRLPLTA